MQMEMTELVGHKSLFHDLPKKLAGISSVTEYIALTKE
jgi:hypothetical protein